MTSGSLTVLSVGGWGSVPIIMKVNQSVFMSLVESEVRRQQRQLAKGFLKIEFGSFQMLQARSNVEQGG